MKRIRIQNGGLYSRFKKDRLEKLPHLGNECHTARLNRACLAALNKLAELDVSQNCRAYLDGKYMGTSGVLNLQGRF